MLAQAFLQPQRYINEAYEAAANWSGGASMWMEAYESIFLG
jgi:hypothetical protein